MCPPLLQRRVLLGFPGGQHRIHQKQGTEAIKSAPLQIICGGDMWTDHPSVPASAFMTVRCVQPLCKQLSFGVSITPKCLGYSVKLHGPKKKSTATSGSGDWTLMTCQEPGLGCLQGKLRGQCQVPGSFMQQFNRPMACWLLTFNAVGFGGVL